MYYFFTQKNIFMRLFVFIFIFIGLGLTGLSAQWNAEDFSGMKIRNIGPAGMSGRITAIDVDLSQPTRIFAGSASGGLWLSENGGTSWQPVFDKESTLSIGCVAINQKNPAEVWVGTGEGNPRNSSNMGKGIYKSLDGGKTWKNMGLEKTKTIHRIYVHPDNQNVVFAAATGSPWGPHPERGVFKTTDGGKTWHNILFINDLTGAADMVVDPKNPNKILVAMWEHQRHPWHFNSGGKGSGLYLTYDGGENWQKIEAKDGIPDGELGRIGLAFAPSKPEIVYALIEAKENGLYRSKDGGKTWKLVSTKNIGDRPFYYAELYVDPKNENRIFNVYTYLSMSEDGGNTFRNIADYGNNVHPDHHAFWIHPEDPTFIIDGNDGGLNISRDGGNTWQFAGNIPVGQFYHVNIDHDFPYNVYGGMQDNGSWVGPSLVLRNGGIRNFDFQELYFGDGFDVAPLPGNSRYGYAMSQGGNLAFFDRVTGITSAIKPVHPVDSVILRYNWNAPLALDPFQTCGVYYGSQFLHYSSDCGKNWTILSPDLTTNNKEKQKADTSGGLTPDATFAENHTTLISIAPSPLDSNVIWTGSDDGLVYITTNRGKNWMPVTPKGKGLPEAGWIAQIEASVHQPGEAFVVMNNYRLNDDAPYLFHTENYGKTWQRIADVDQIKGFVLSVVQDIKEPDLLFLGTDVGLYISFDKGQHWQHWHESFPSVQISDMKIQPEAGDLVLATFGRSIWVMDDIRPLRTLASKGIGILDSTLIAFESPEAYLSTNTSFQGTRFIAQGEFVGENKSLNQSSTYIWVKAEKNTKNSDDEKKASKSGKKEQEKIKVEVYDSQHHKIRTFFLKYEGKGGISVIRWNLRQDGIETPRREKRKEKEDQLPSGKLVGPGSYTLVFTYKNRLDSTVVVVKDDPRKDKFWPATYDTKNSIVYDSLIMQITREIQKLQDAKSSLEIVDKLIENQPDSVKTAMKALHKNIRSEIDSLENLFFNKENIKGIQRDPAIIMAKVFEASEYISERWHGNEGNADLALSHAITAANSGMEAIRKFIDNTWVPYQEKVKNLPLIIFKE